VANDLVRIRAGERAMDRWAQAQLVEWAAGKGAKSAETLHREIDEIAGELAGENPSPTESLLARVAALDWFALKLYEARYFGASSSEEGMTPAQSEHALRRIDRTHRRLMAGLKTLANVRRLALPALQVNLAHQQVNVAGSFDVPRASEQ
jgi:hypothetical protein